MSENATPQPAPSSSWIARVRKRTFVAAGLFVAVGSLLAFAPKPTDVRHDEAWVAAGLPSEFDGYRMAPPRESGVPEYCTYKMDPTTYSTLNPWGIVAREFDNGQDKYDVVVIGSNSKDSFHDPTVCFGAQSWSLSNAREEYLDTKTRGRVPVTMMDMQKDGRKTVVMYFYRLRDGYVASNGQAKMEMLLYPFSKNHVGANNEGGFIRIIPTGADGENADRLKAFAAKWVDAASETSKGYY